METVFFTYLIVISVFSAIVTVFDKLRAIRHGRRVSEKNLLLLSAIGGSGAMFVTMLLVRHKIRHLKFMLGIPAIIVVQLIIVYVLGRVLHA